MSCSLGSIYPVVSVLIVLLAPRRAMPRTAAGKVRRAALVSQRNQDGDKARCEAGWEEEKGGWHGWHGEGNYGDKVQGDADARAGESSGWHQWHGHDGQFVVKLMRRLESQALKVTKFVAKLVLGLESLVDGMFGMVRMEETKFVVKLMVAGLESQVDGMIGIGN